MATGTPGDITGLLRAWRQGEQGALEQLIPLVEEELRRIAHRHLRSRKWDASLTTTVLVDEAYVRLIDARQVGWPDRAHFFGLCARIMRGILVDHARAHQCAKRGGGAPHVPLEDEAVGATATRRDLVAIDEALSGLARVDPRKSRVVELRFFGGMTVEETAEVLSVSRETVARDWRLAKLWLLRELQEPVRKPAAAQRAAPLT